MDLVESGGEAGHLLEKVSDIHKRSVTGGKFIYLGERGRVRPQKVTVDRMYAKRLSCFTKDQPVGKTCPYMTPFSQGKLSKKFLSQLGIQKKVGKPKTLKF